MEMEDGTAALACLVLSLRFNNQILLHRLLGLSLHIIIIQVY